MNRTLEQWALVDAQLCAKRNSVAANEYLIRDAQKDIAELQADLTKARELLSSIFDISNKTHNSNSLFLLKTKMSAIAQSIDPATYWHQLPAPAAKGESNE